MLFCKKTAAEKRADLRAALKSGRLLQFPGAHAPIVARVIELRLHCMDGASSSLHTAFACRCLQRLLIEEALSH